VTEEFNAVRFLGLALKEIMKKKSMWDDKLVIINKYL
jgi:hypothetical protein